MKSQNECYVLCFSLVKRNKKKLQVFVVYKGFLGIALSEVCRKRAVLKITIAATVKEFIVSKDLLRNALLREFFENFKTAFLWQFLAADFDTSTSNQNCSFTLQTSLEICVKMALLILNCLIQDCEVKQKVSI